MGLVLKKNIANSSFLGIWKKEEDLDFLENIFVLNDTEKSVYSKISNVYRKKEFITIRVLLTELLQSRKTIVYNENKGPSILNSGLNISITHSKHFVALIISASYIPGIDIEHISDRVEKVKHKFLTQNEASWIKNHALLTAAWSTKEAIFKTFGKNLDFKDIELHPFNLDDEAGIFAAEVLKPGFEITFKLNYQLFENDILVYTLRR